MARKLDPNTYRPTRVFSVRLDGEEFAALTQIMAQHNLTKRNTAIRALIRAGGGLLEVDKDVIAAWRTSGRALAQAGNNINQLARVANRGDLLWDAAERSDMRELRKLCLDTARRLRDFAKSASSRSASKATIANAIEDLNNV